jgi:nitrite reductase/ring-hydroxylating ferredoxin subunit
MIKQRKKGRNRPFFILKAFIFSLLSVGAFLESTPSHPDGTLENTVWKVSQLKANKNEKQDRDSASEASEGFSRFFSSSKKKEEKIETESTDIFKSFSKWRESRKSKLETETIQNKKGVTEAFKSFKSSQRTDESVGKIDKNSRIRLPQSNDQAVREGGNSDDGNKRTSPLNAAQKFVSNVIAKQKFKEKWVVVASKTGIAPGAIVPVTAAGLDLLLVASKDGTALYCIANSCPHLGTPLEIGLLDRRPIEYSDSTPVNSMVKSQNLQQNYIAKLLAQDGCENCIVCPLHKTAFALESGEVRGVSLFFSF